MAGENPYDDILPGEEPDPNDSASPRAVADKERQQREEREEGLRLWRAILSDPVGRREIWRLIEQAGVFRPTFAYTPVGFPHPEATWFQAGMKDFGQRLYLGLARHHRDLVLLMHDEHDPNFSETKPAPEAAPPA